MLLFSNYLLFILKLLLNERLIYSCQKSLKKWKFLRENKHCKKKHCLRKRININNAFNNLSKKKSKRPQVMTFTNAENVGETRSKMHEEIPESWLTIRIGRGGSGGTVSENLEDLSWRCDAITGITFGRCL